MTSFAMTSLDRYRASLRHSRPLDASTEQELARAWAAGDEQAGEKIIEACLPFVIRVAREYRRWGVPLEDLIQQGNLGLLRAAKKFDADKECRLITYAVYWIRAEIRDYVMHSHRIVRLGTTRTERRAIRVFRRHQPQTAEQLAEESGMPVKRARKLWPLLSGGDLSLDYQTSDQGPAMDRVPTDAMSPEEEAHRRQATELVREALASALEKLSDRERRIVRERMMTDEPTSLEAMGREMGVSKERVRQIQERVRLKLRTELAALAPV